jgi:protoheme IX farnesyltransferase
MRFRDDYARAGVPMLPVVATEAVVADRIVWYSWAMVAISLALWPIASTTPLYPVAAIALGAVFLREAHRLRARTRLDQPVSSMRLFHWSITYLSGLFAAVAADALIQQLIR